MSGIFGEICRKLALTALKQSEERRDYREPTPKNHTPENPLEEFHQYRQKPYSPSQEKGQKRPHQ